MSITKSIINFLKKLKSLLFYECWTCEICKTEVFNGEYVCKDCQNRLERLSLLNSCDHCGRKTIMSMPYCNTCTNALTNFEVSKSVFNYVQPITNLIHEYKYNGAKYLKNFFASELELLYRNNQELKADVITYIPMTKKSLKKRKYNQTKLLAEILSTKLNLPMVEPLEKVKETSRQATLNKRERQMNLKSAYKLKNKKEIQNKVVLIVDDVTTTGSTINNVSKILTNGGAKSVKAITIASVATNNYN